MSHEAAPDATPASRSLNFIEQKVEADLAAGKHGGAVRTRFPPEPNGYLHIGHAKAICVSFGIAQKYGGTTHLRFDDTNPEKEDVEYVESIRNDIQWLGFEWNGGEYFTSDYFEQLFNMALQLIDAGHAYVDDQSADEIAAQKGSPGVPGTESPFRGRSAEENRDLFVRMRAGEFAEGSRVLRARIDMASDNMLLRDPIIYRIKFAHHHRTGDAWCLYPMYDFAHGQSDALERITHSLCSLEFENHRPLYDWFILTLGLYPSEQTEFARLNLNYTLLEWALRDDLNRTAPRAMAVLRPVRLVLENYPVDAVEWLPSEVNPEDPEAGHRDIPFSRELWVEEDDFRLEPDKKWFRLAPGATVRLKSAYIVTCTGYDLGPDGRVTEIRATYLPESKSGSDTSGLKVKGTLHWVSASHAFDAEVRLYDRLFADPEPDGHEGRDFLEFINPESLTVLSGCKLEPALAEALPGQGYQFTRLGYFTPDARHSRPHAPVFNRAVTLKDGWKG